MTNELATTFETMMAEAKTLVDSGFLPKAIRTPAQALAIMTMSKELGIGYWTGFNGINVISGKPTISPQLMLALIFKRHPEAVIQINGDAQSCTVFMQRRDGQSHTEVFTIDQASKIMTKEDDKTIPLTQKYNWRQQPAVMLKWRAVAACARVIFPDVIMGFYGPEEIDPDVTVDETGEMIQQHPAIEAEIVQDARETHQNSQGSTETAQGGQPQAETPKEWPARPWGLATVRAWLETMYDNMSAESKATAMTTEEHKKLGQAVSHLFPDRASRHVFQYMMFGGDNISIEGMSVATGKTYRAWARDVKNAKLEVESIIATAEFAETATALASGQTELG